MTLILRCPMCNAALRSVIAKPPAFTERDKCDTCEVIWLIEVDPDREMVTFYDESGLIKPVSICIGDI